MIWGTETSGGGGGSHTPLDGILIALYYHKANTLLAVQSPYMNGYTAQGLALQIYSNTCVWPTKLWRQMSYTFVDCLVETWEQANTACRREHKIRIEPGITHTQKKNGYATNLWQNQYNEEHI